MFKFNFLPIRVSYWVIPLLAGTIWLSNLIIHLVYYYTTLPSSPTAIKKAYPWLQPKQHIPYLSDIAASRTKPLFITLCVLSGIFRTLTYSVGTYLRYRGRLPTSGRTIERVVGCLTVLTAGIGSVSMVLLGIFDTYHYRGPHYGFLWVFLATSIINAVGGCWELWIVGKFHEDPINPEPLTSLWIKVTLISLGVVPCIALWVTHFGKNYNVAAVFEWLLCFGSSFFIISFIPDLLLPGDMGTVEKVVEDKSDAETDVDSGTFPVKSLSIEQIV